MLSRVERGALLAAARFYRIPRLLFAPNQEMVTLLSQKTAKPCFLMSHSVDTTVFSPRLRDRTDRQFRIGYVGRLTTEKNVRVLAQIEHALFNRGHPFLTETQKYPNLQTPGRDLCLSRFL